MAKDQSTEARDAKIPGKPAETPKPSLIESLKKKLQTKRQKLKKEDPNIYPMW